VTSAITVEDQVWVAAQAFLGPGIIVGRGSVIGAGAIVMKDVPSDSLVSAPVPIVSDKVPIKSGNKLGF
jgi:acetyltransferase-like isoleucine patch superfamily enzyme